MADEHGTAARFSEAVDLATGFAQCWTHGGSLAAAEEWARQLHAELADVLALAAREQTQRQALEEIAGGYGVAAAIARDALAADAPAPAPGETFDASAATSEGNG